MTSMGRGHGLAYRLVNDAVDLNVSHQKSEHFTTANDTKMQRTMFGL